MIREGQKLSYSEMHCKLCRWGWQNTKLEIGYSFFLFFTRFLVMFSFLPVFTVLTFSLIKVVRDHNKGFTKLAKSVCVIPSSSKRCQVLVLQGCTSLCYEAGSIKPCSCGPLLSVARFHPDLFINWFKPAMPDMWMSSDIHWYNTMRSISNHMSSK